ncbi:MAG: transcription elongation factor GreA [Pirellulaceae bacterium]|nr:transcription elongation factor GreA [Pirellulaceae bacterium]
MSDRVPMTQAGYKKIKDRIRQMEEVEMPAITEKIAEARAEGDLKENAEYHAQRENQGQLQAKISMERAKLSKADIIDPSKINQNEVSFGATVTLVDLDTEEEEEITLVGAGEEDYDQGHYLVTSPFGQGLLGRKKGEEVEIDVPQGTLAFRIVEIDYSYLDG